MNQVFVDTWFFLAILNPRDPNHGRAASVNWDERRHRVTTDWVLVETGDALCRDNRDVFVRYFDWIRQHPGITVIPASRELLNQGMQLYRSRRDKEWSLTDCISFVVMEDEGITEALTADRHFGQAGFKALPG